MVNETLAVCAPGLAVAATGGVAGDAGVEAACGTEGEVPAPPPHPTTLRANAELRAALSSERYDIKMRTDLEQDAIEDVNGGKAWFLLASGKFPYG